MDVLSTFYVFLIDCLSVVIVWRYVSLELHICLTCLFCLIEISSLAKYFQVMSVFIMTVTNQSKIL